MLQAQVDRRKTLIMKPLESMNALPNQEFMKGEIAMGEFSLRVPLIMFESIDIELKELSDETA